jgi:ribosomal peptide maturation radical SAM protein 1
MPFASHRRPSIQLGLLTAAARARGYDVAPLHLNLELAAVIGGRLYEALSDSSELMLGEWLFARAAFGAEAPASAERFVARFETSLRPLLEGTGAGPADLLDLRGEVVDRYLRAMLEQADWRRFRAVGFTSTFQQNCPSIAFARVLHDHVPDAWLIFGGANFDGDMGRELVRAVDVIDFAVTGEGDEALPELLDALRTGREPTGVPGVIAARAGAVRAPRPRRLLTDLDRLPAPDYDDYFARAERLGFIPPAPARSRVTVPFESARGCWWGAKHHCTFCGLNPDTMPFRAKSAEAVRTELDAAARRYRTRRFASVDNILDPRQLRQLFPALAADGASYELFYEVKANLSAEQLAVLAAGGVRAIQPGIESLSSRVLRLMRKGVTAAQNVNLLRWARAHRITVVWNLLYGFPGETVGDCRAQEALIPGLTHLEPPMQAGRIRLERFSPLFSGGAEGVTEARPSEPYQYIYPADFDLTRVAYFFDYEIADTVSDADAEPLGRSVAGWRASWTHGSPTLTYDVADEVVVVTDARAPGRPQELSLEGLVAEVFLGLVRRPRVPAALFAELGFSAARARAGERAVAHLCETGLAMCDGDACLALPVPAAADAAAGGITELRAASSG